MPAPYNEMGRHQSIRTRGGIPLAIHTFGAPDQYEWVSMHESQPLMPTDIAQLELAYAVALDNGGAFTDLIARSNAGFIINGVTLAVLDGEDCTFAVVFGEGSCKWAERKLVQ